MPVKIFNVAKKANKQLSKIPLKIQGKIIQALKDLKQNPIAGAKLEGKLSDKYKFRVGDYRIVYKLDVQESKVEIVKIEHRQGVYK